MAPSMLPVKFRTLADDPGTPPTNNAHASIADVPSASASDQASRLISSTFVDFRTEACTARSCGAEINVNLTVIMTGCQERGARILEKIFGSSYERRP